MVTFIIKGTTINRNDYKFEEEKGEFFITDLAPTNETCIEEGRL